MADKKAVAEMVRISLIGAWAERRRELDAVKRLPELEQERDTLHAENQKLREMLRRGIDVADQDAQRQWDADVVALLAQGQP